MQWILFYPILPFFWRILFSFNKVSVCLCLKLPNKTHNVSFSKSTISSLTPLTDKPTSYCVPLFHQISNKPENNINSCPHQFLFPSLSDIYCSHKFATKANFAMLASWHLCMNSRSGFYTKTWRGNIVAFCFLLDLSPFPRQKTEISSQTFPDIVFQYPDLSEGWRTISIVTWRDVGSLLQIIVQETAQLSDQGSIQVEMMDVQDIG